MKKLKSALCILLAAAMLFTSLQITGETVEAATAYTSETTEGTYTIGNPGSDSRTSQYFYVNVAAYSTISFNISVDASCKYYAVWIIGDNSVEYYAAQKSCSTTAVTVTNSVDITTSLEYFYILVEFRDSDSSKYTGDMSAFTATISNVTITEPSLESDFTLSSPSSSDSRLTYTTYTTVPAGAVISFDIVTGGGSFSSYAVWIYDLNGNEYYAYGGLSSGTTKHVENYKTSFTEDVVGFRIIIEFRNSSSGKYTGSDLSSCYATISNLQVKTLDVLDGTIVIENPSNDYYFEQVIAQSVSAGSTITFDFELNESCNYAVWVLGDGSWDKTYYAKGTSGTGISVSAVAEEDLDYFVIAIQYRLSDGQTKDTTTDKTGRVATISNLTVWDGYTGIGYDGTITFTNPTANSRAEISLDVAVKEGDTISFNIETNNLTPYYAVWVYDLNSSEWYAAQVTGSNTVTCTAQCDSPAVRIIVEFRNSSGGKYTGSEIVDCTATVTDFTVTSGEAQYSLVRGGTITMVNSGADGTSDAVLYYDFYGDFKTGDTIKFDLTANSQESLTLWVLCEGGWNSTSAGITTNEFYAKNYSSGIDGHVTVSATVKSDCSFVRFYVKFYGTYTTNINHAVSITDLKLTTAATTDYTELSIIGLHSSTAYVEDSNQWNIYLKVDDTIPGYADLAQFDYLEVSVNGVLGYARAKTVSSDDDSTSKILYLTLTSAIFQDGILENSEVKILAGYAKGYADVDGDGIVLTGEGIYFASDYTFYLNAFGASDVDYMTHYSGVVTPEMDNTKTSTATTLYLTMDVEMATGVAIVADDDDSSGIFIDYVKTEDATLVCTTDGYYTLTLPTAAEAGTKVEIVGRFIGGNYVMTVVKTQFTYNGYTWAETVFVELDETGLTGDCDSDDNLTVADLVRIMKYLKDSYTTINTTDGDANSDGYVDEQDMYLLKQILVGGYTFNNGYNVTPGAPTYEDAEEELAIGAYCGPRRIGPTHYDGVLGDARYTDYRTDETFAMFAAAGFNFVIAENDAAYGTIWDAWGNGTTEDYSAMDLSWYMKLAAKYGVNVIVEYGLLNEMLHGTTEITDANLNLLAKAMANLSQEENFMGFFMADEPYPAYYDDYVTIANYIKNYLPNAVLYTSCHPYYSSDSTITSIMSVYSGSTLKERYTQYLTEFSAALGSLNYDFYSFRQTEYTISSRDTTSMRSEWLANLEIAATIAHGNYDAGVTIQSMAWKASSYSKLGGYTSYREVTEADLSFQLYTALAYGMKTITYYTYWEHYYQSSDENYYCYLVGYPDEEGDDPVYTDLYYAAVAVNNEIKQFDEVYMTFSWQGTIGIAKKDSDGLIAAMSDYSSNRISSYSATNDAIIGCLRDENGYDGFMIVNVTDPDDSLTSVVTVNFADADMAIVYVDGEETIVTLSNGTLSVSLAPGEGVFVIPYISE